MTNSPSFKNLTISLWEGKKRGEKQNLRANCILFWGEGKKRKSNLPSHAPGRSRYKSKSCVYKRRKDHFLSDMSWREKEGKGAGSYFSPGGKRFRFHIFPFREGGKKGREGRRQNVFNVRRRREKEGGDEWRFSHGLGQ